jgi:hypothetical protein
MSLFEFVTVKISMILALTLGQLLSGVTFLLRSSGEVRWYAPHTLWVSGLGLTLVNHWWALWDFRDLDWNYATFLYILIAPLLIFLAVGLLTPDRTDPDSNDMQRQFARVRRPFGALVCAYVLAMWFDGPLLAGQDPLGGIGLLHLPILAAAAVPLATEGRKANLLAPALFITSLAMIMVIRFRSIG